MPLTWWLESVRRALFPDIVSAIGGEGSVWTTSVTGDLPTDRDESLVMLLVTTVVVTLAAVVASTAGASTAPRNGGCSTRSPGPDPALTGRADAHLRRQPSPGLRGGPALDRRLPRPARDARVLLTEAPDGFIVQGLVMPGTESPRGPDPTLPDREGDYTFLDEDIARFIEEALARRRRGGRRPDVRARRRLRARAARHRPLHRRPEAEGRLPLRAGRRLRAAAADGTRQGCKHQSRRVHAADLESMVARDRACAARKRTSRRCRRHPAARGSRPGRSCRMRRPVPSSAPTRTQTTAPSDEADVPPRRSIMGIIKLIGAAIGC